MYLALCLDRLLRFKGKGILTLDVTYGRPVACPELRVTCLLEAWSRRDKQKFLRGHFLEALEHEAQVHKIQALSLYLSPSLSSESSIHDAIQ